MADNEISGRLAGIVEVVGTHSTVLDILVPAFEDLESAIPEVRPFVTSVYFRTRSGYLIVAKEPGGGQLRLSSADSIENPPELMEEPTIRPTFLNLTSVYLDEVEHLDIVRISVYLDSDPTPQEGDFQAIALHFSNGTLLLDSYWIAGIYIGLTQGGARPRWANEAMVEHTFAIAPRY